MCEFRLMATTWHIQRSQHGYEPAFINMAVVRGCFVVAADGQWSEDGLEYDAKDDSQHAIMPDGGPVRGPVPNRTLGFRPGSGRSRTHAQHVQAREKTLGEK
jgi:hypothetical protein